MISTHLANDKNVGEPGGKAVASTVLNVHHIEGAGMLLSISDHANTPQVSTSGHHAHVTYLHRGKDTLSGDVNKKQKQQMRLEAFCLLTSFKLDVICYFASVQVNTDSVVDLDQRIRITNGAGIMGYQMWDSLCANEYFPHLAQFILKSYKNKHLLANLSPSTVQKCNSER